MSTVMSLKLILTFVFLVLNGCTSTDNQKTLSFVGFANPPFDSLVRYPNGTFSYQGTSLKIVEWLARRFNFLINIVPVNQTLVEKLGTHEAAFHQLINDENIDGVSCSFYITLDRKDRMDFTFLTWSEGFRLIVPRPEEESRLFAFIGPFQPIVWILILLSSIAIIFIMSFFSFSHHRLNKAGMRTSITSTSDRPFEKPENSLSDGAIQQSIPRATFLQFLGTHSMYVLNILTNHGCRVVSRQFSFKFLIAFWLLAIMVVVYSYSSIVISSLTVPRMQKTIDSLEDLAASKEVGVVLRHDVSIGEQILKATSGTYKILGDQARRHPERIVGDPVKLNALLQTGRFAFPFVNTFCASFIALQYKKDKHCRFKLSKPLTASTGYYHFPMKKKDPRLKMFSKALMDLWEYGLVRFWVKQIMPRADECFATRQQKTANQKPIRLRDLTSAFLILGIGCGLAIFAFVVELAVAISLKK